MGRLFKVSPSQVIGKLVHGLAETGVCAGWPPLFRGLKGVAAYKRGCAFKEVL